MYPSPIEKSVTSLVVCLPLWVFLLSVFVAKSSSGKSLFKSVDLPTPEAPANAAILSLRFSAINALTSSMPLSSWQETQNTSKPASL